MPYTAGILLLAAAVAIVTGAVLQLLQYRRGEHIITRGQLVWRLITAALLLSIIVLIFLGAVYTFPNPVHELLFWFSLVVMGIIVIILAMYDLRMVERQRHIKQAELYRSIQSIQDSARKKTGEGADGDTDTDKDQP